MEVGNEDPSELESGAVAHHLALSTLTAVEEHELALTLDSEGAHIPSDGGSRCCRAKEGDSNHGRPDERERRATTDGMEGSECPVGSEEAYLEPERAPGLREATLIEDGKVARVRERQHHSHV